MLESYFGKYQLKPKLIIEITQEGSQLRAIPTGQPVFDIFPKPENAFYLKVVDTQLTFNKNVAGDVEGVILFQGGREMIGNKM